MSGKYTDDLAENICTNCNGLNLCYKHALDNSKKLRFHNIDEIKPENKKVILQEAFNKNLKILDSCKMSIIQEFNGVSTAFVEKFRSALKYMNDLEASYSNLILENLDSHKIEMMLQEDFLFYKNFEFTNTDFHEILNPVFRYVEKAVNLIIDSINLENQSLNTKTILSQRAKKKFCNSCHAQFYIMEDNKVSQESKDALCEECQHLKKCENCENYIRKTDQILDGMCFECQECFTRCPECNKKVANNLYNENEQKCYRCLGSFVCEECDSLFSKLIFSENFNAKYSEPRKCPQCLDLKYCEVCDSFDEKEEMHTETKCIKCLGFIKCPKCKRKGLECHIKFLGVCSVCYGFEQCRKCNDFYEVFVRPDLQLCTGCVNKRILN